jgi:hypothetical protein
LLGIIFAYKQFGNDVGFYVLLGTGVATGVALYLSFRNGAWNKVSNKSAIKSKVNEGMAAHLNEGEEGNYCFCLAAHGLGRFSMEKFLK